MSAVTWSACEDSTALASGSSARAVLAAVGHLVDGLLAAQRLPLGVGDLEAGHAEHERLEGSPGVLVVRQRGEHGDTHLLSDVVRDRVGPGVPTQPGPAVPVHALAHAGDEGLDRVGLPRHRSGDELGPQSPPVDVDRSVAGLRV